MGAFPCVSTSPPSSVLRPTDERLPPTAKSQIHLHRLLSLLGAVLILTLGFLYPSYTSLAVDPIWAHVGAAGLFAGLFGASYWSKTIRSNYVVLLKSIAVGTHVSLHQHLRNRGNRLCELTNIVPGVVFRLKVQPDGTYDPTFVGEHAEPVLGMSPTPSGFYERFLACVPSTHRDKSTESIDRASKTRSPGAMNYLSSPPPGNDPGFWELPSLNDKERNSCSMGPSTTVPTGLASCIEGESLMAQAYRSGTTIVADTLHARETDCENGALRSSACVPIENRGVLSIACTEARGIDPFDVRLIEVLTTHRGGTGPN